MMKEERQALRAEHLASLPLTAREREIPALSVRTAQKHLEHVFQKIGVECGARPA